MASSGRTKTRRRKQKPPAEADGDCLDTGASKVDVADQPGFQTRSPSIDYRRASGQPPVLNLPSCTVRAQAYHQGPEALDDDLPAGTQLVELPRKVELKMAGAPEISKFQKRKKKAKHAKIKIFQDAANSCRIDVDDDGNLECVMMSDDLANTFLQFGKETVGETDPIILQDNREVPMTPKKKAHTKNVKRIEQFAGIQVEQRPWESIGGMGQSKKYKKVKLKKTKLKGKAAKVELLYAADRADLVVDEYTDEIGKVYVAFPDRQQHKTYLFGLPERLDVITEEFSREIPIRRAIDDKACWYVQDTSSEESEEEDECRPQMAEMALDALDDDMPGPNIGFSSSPSPNMRNTRMVLE